VKNGERIVLSILKNSPLSAWYALTLEKIPSTSARNRSQILLRQRLLQTHRRERHLSDRSSQGVFPEVCLLSPFLA